MLKSTITDTQVRIIPSDKLIDFLKQEGKHANLMPENVAKLIGKKSKVFVDETDIKPVKFNETERKLLEEINKTHEAKETSAEEDNEKTSGIEDLSDESEKLVKDVPAEPEITSKRPDDTRKYLTNSDFKWIFNFLQERRKIDSSTPYLNELMEGSEVILPENEYIERNPELEERCKKLRKEQEQREYDKMTKNVDSVRKRDPDESIGYHIRAINSQLIAILQFIFSVAAGFAFGFIGIALIVGDLDFGFRLLLGIMFALIIALAEIYFLAKKLNEDYETKPSGPIYNDYGATPEVAAQVKKTN